MEKFLTLISNELLGEESPLINAQLLNNPCRLPPTTIYILIKFTRVEKTKNAWVERGKRRARFGKMMKCHLNDA